MASRLPCSLYAPGACSAREIARRERYRKRRPPARGSTNPDHRPNGVGRAGKLLNKTQPAVAATASEIKMSWSARPKDHLITNQVIS